MTSVTGNGGQGVTRQTGKIHRAYRPCRAKFGLVTATNGVDLLIGLAVLVFVLVRQLQPRRPVRDNMRLQLIIVVIGVVELALPGPRAPRCRDLRRARGQPGHRRRLRRDPCGHRARMGRRGQAWRQRNWLTALLWIVSFGAQPGLGLPRRG
jgi:hypothetical protein